MSLWAPVKSLARIYAFVAKELLEAVRRPAALVALVAGPFLIMAVFGAGYSGQRRPLDTVVVIPPASGLPTQVSYYQGLVGPAVRIVEVAGSAAGPEAELRAQKVDLVIVAPADGRERVAAGKQAVVRVDYNVEDPVLSNYDYLLGQQIQQEVNKLLVEQAVSAAEGRAPSSLATFPPQTVAQPTVVDAQNFAPTPPAIVDFYGPAVFALILQHLAVTMTALSLVRERLSGAFEVFQVSPAGAFEILLGKYLAFAILNAAIGAIVALLLVRVLGVPFLGSLEVFVGVVALLTFASLGIGMLISIVSDSERQAVQLSLLLLLASVFFSGFVLPVEEFVPAVRGAAYLLPVTHGIRLVQDLMLRGILSAWWEAAALAGIGLACFGTTLALVRRRLRPA